MGKSAALNMLEHFIQEITFNRSTNYKIYYPPVIDFPKEEQSVIKSCIIVFLKGIKETIFSQNKTNLFIKKSIDFDNDSLLRISNILHNYLSDIDSENSWNELLDYFTLKNDNITIKYIKPEKNFILFRIDEIGDITNSNIIYDEDYKALHDYFSTLNFCNPFKLMRLYVLRDCINLFCTDRIDVIVAGKNSFMPFMGKLNFHQSSNRLITINLNPLNANNDSKYIENIVLYHLLTIDKGKSILKQDLIDIKNSIVNDDQDKKIKYNKMMNNFYELIGHFTGGHPRMIKRLLEFFDLISFKEYFIMDLDSKNGENYIKKLFEDKKENFISKNEDIFTKFLNNELFESIINVSKKNKIKIEPEDILHIMYLVYENPSDVIYLCNLLINIVTDFENKKFKSSKIQLTPKDIIDSLGILYVDEREYSSINEDFDYSNTKFNIPIFLIEYIKNNKKTFVDHLNIFKFLKNFSIFKTPIPRSYLDKIMIWYYSILFKYEKETRKFMNKLKKIYSDINVEDYLKFNFVQIEKIDGYSQSANYIQKLQTQINEKLEKWNKRNILILTPKIHNNYIHDFFILIPSSINIK